MSNAEDAITKDAVTVPISVASAQTTTILAVGAGRRWHLMGLYIRAAGEETVIFQSEGNALSGAVELEDKEVMHLPMGKVPHMSGLATGEDFKITTGLGVAIDGWATITEEK